MPVLSSNMPLQGRYMLIHMSLVVKSCNIKNTYAISINKETITFPETTDTNYSTSTNF